MAKNASTNLMHTWYMSLGRGIASRAHARRPLVMSIPLFIGIAFLGPVPATPLPSRQLSPFASSARPSSRANIRACPLGEHRVVRHRVVRRRVEIDGRWVVTSHRVRGRVTCRRSVAVSQETAPPTSSATGSPSTTSTTPGSPPSTSTPTTTTIPGGSDGFDPIITSQWAGYFETPDAVTSASATWVVPTLTCSGTETTLSSTWVGVGGFAGGALLQAGMYDNCINGVATQGAFAEEYPGSTVSFALFILPGDTVTASVLQTASGWSATVADLTSGQSATAEAPDYAGGGSAEWMAEAYGTPGGVPMSDIGSEQLTSFLVDAQLAVIPESDVYAMTNVTPTDPSSGVYRLTYN
jgi:hypothetical protein